MNIFKHSSAPALAVDDMTVHIEEPASDPPEFKRIYTTKLVYVAADGASVDIRLKITCRTGIFGDRDQWDGELTQDNGKWVMFDPRNPADKIIDRALCPLVVIACNQILASDTAWINSKPEVFEDRRGVKWQRVK